MKKKKRSKDAKILINIHKEKNNIKAYILN